MKVDRVGRGVKSAVQDLKCCFAPSPPSHQIHRLDSYRSSSERLEAAAAAHYRTAGAGPPPAAAPRHLHHQQPAAPAAAPPRQRGPSAHAASRSNSGSEVYERMAGGGGGGPGNGQAHPGPRGHLDVSDDDSEYSSSMDRRGDRLVRPSQVKKNRSQGKERNAVAVGLCVSWLRSAAAHWYQVIIHLFSLFLRLPPVCLSASLPLLPPPPTQPTNQPTLLLS